MSYKLIMYLDPGTGVQREGKNEIMVHEIFCFLFIMLFIIPNHAHAYLDPGTDSMLPQALAAILLAGGVFWRRIIALIKEIFHGNSSSSPGESDVGARQRERNPGSKLLKNIHLEANDILFIDSSHVLRSGNDVHYEYLEILPRLNPGVYVHIHDISLPEEYPVVYYQTQLFWTEQYLRQAFLTFNNRYKVIWPDNFLAVKFPDRINELFYELAEMRKEWPLSEPTAFWMRS